MIYRIGFVTRDADSMKNSRPYVLCTGLLGSCLLLASGNALAGPAATLALMAQEAAAATPAPALNPSHPDQYVVKAGDTLWGISAMFLRDPWYWPEIWHANPQIANPHLIYPGDVLNLVYVDGQPRVEVQRASAAAVTTAEGRERLSPRVREQGLEAAIPTISLQVIGAFLNRGSVLQPDEIKQTPYVVAIRGGNTIGAAGNELYVRGDLAGEGQGYSVVHMGERLIDPDTGDTLGYEGIYVGAGTLRRAGDPATLFLTDTTREAMEGDRLILRDVSFPAYFTPRAPDQPVEGSIIHVVDGVTQIGQWQVIIVNRGSRDGLQPGHVLRVWQRGTTVADRSKPGRVSSKVRLPDEPAGLSMVFRSYERMSYALVVRATSEIHELDIVKNPN